MTDMQTQIDELAARVDQLDSHHKARLQEHDRIIGKVSDAADKMGNVLNKLTGTDWYAEPTPRGTQGEGILMATPEHVEAVAMARAAIAAYEATLPKASTDDGMAVLKTFRDAYNDQARKFGVPTSDTHTQGEAMCQAAGAFAVARAVQARLEGQ